jgi:methyl-accepting chemotaxis protein
VATQNIVERDRIERLDQELAQLQRDCAASANESARRARIVAMMIRVFGLLMTVLALSNLYFVNDLTQEVRLVVARMDEMADYFARVSDRMRDMRREVSGMEENVRLLPVVDLQVTEIAAHVGAMGAGVEQMRRSTSTLDRQVGHMHGAMSDMALRFRAMNASVGAMGVDVREMAKPVP